MSAWSVPSRLSLELANACSTSAAATSAEPSAAANEVPLQVANPAVKSSPSRVSRRWGSPGAFGAGSMETGPLLPRTAGNVLTSSAPLAQYPTQDASSLNIALLPLGLSAPMLTSGTSGPAVAASAAG